MLSGQQVGFQGNAQVLRQVRFIAPQDRNFQSPVQSELRRVCNSGFVSSQVARLQSNSKQLGASPILGEEALLGAMSDMERVIRIRWPLASQRMECFGEFVKENAPDVLGVNGASLNSLQAGCQIIRAHHNKDLMGTAYCGMLAALATKSDFDCAAPFVRQLTSPQDTQHALQALQNWASYAALPHPKQLSPLQEVIIGTGPKVNALLEEFAKEPMVQGDPRVFPAIGMARDLCSLVDVPEFLLKQTVALVRTAMRKD